MDVRRFIVGSVVAFIFVSAFEFLFHGVILAGTYEATAEVWRPEGEHKMPFLIGSQLLFAIAAVFFFTRNYQGRRIGEGVRFGLYVGLILASVKLAEYCYLPIPGGLLVAWLIADLLKGLGTGIVASLIYRPKRIEAV